MVHNGVIPDILQTILTFLIYFYFFLFWLNDWHHFIFQITYAFFCIICSAVYSFQCVFHFSYNISQLWLIVFYICFSSVQFSHSFISDSLWPYESQYARLLCPSSTFEIDSNSRPLSQWCHPAISSSVIPFSSCPQSLPASESFTMSQLFAWGGQSTGVSALASFLPKKSQDRSPLDWTGWISLQSKGLTRVFSNTTVQ